MEAGDILGAVAGAMAGMSLIFTIVSVIMIIAQWKLFTKAGKPGWAAIIPIYNTYVFFEIAEGNGVKMFLSLIPIIGFIFPIIATIKLAKAFGKGTGFGLGLLFFAPICYPILAFSKDTEYLGPQV